MTQKSGAKKMKTNNNGWVTQKLGQIVEMTSGGTPDKKHKEYYEGGTIPWVRSGELDKGVITDSEVKITQAGLDNSSAKIFPKGTLLIAMYGATIGKLAYLGIDAATNQAICAMFKNDTILLEYLYYFLLFQRPNLVKQGIGGAQPNISQTILKKLEISYPVDLEEQKRIVDRIEELLSQLDEGVETLRKTQAQLEVYRQAVLKEAFEKANAEECRLEDLCFFITKGTTPSKDKMIAGKGDIPFIKVYNLTFDNSLDFSIDPTFVDTETHTGFLARSIVRPGDVLMNIVGPPMGKVSIVPDTYSEWNINQAIARFRCLECVDNKYLAYYLGYAGTVEKLKRKAKATAGQFNLTLEICRDVMIPLPSLETQKQIVFEIETRLSQCEQILRTVELALQQADAMRKSILKQAFEGRL